MTSFLGKFFKMHFYIVAFAMLTIGKHVEENIKSSFYICIKFVERRPKNVWKMSPGGVHIMMDTLETSI